MSPCERRLGCPAGARAAVSSGTGANLFVRHAMGGDLHDVRFVLGQPRIDALGICFCSPLAHRGVMRGRRRVRRIGDDADLVLTDGG
jgi:hypothetical protein